VGIARLAKPLSRTLTVSRQEVIITLVPEEAGIPAHIKLRLPDHHKAFRSITIDPPSDGELANR